MVGLLCSHRPPNLSLFKGQSEHIVPEVIALLAGRDKVSIPFGRPNPHSSILEIYLTSRPHRWWFKVLCFLELSTSGKESIAFLCPLKLGSA